MYGMWGENMQMKQRGGISTVYGMAERLWRRRHRRISSATRVSLVTAGHNAVGGPAAAAVKILIRRISERGSNYCANYHFNQWIALESSSDVFRETFIDTTTKEPTNQPTHNLQSRRNKMKETTAPIGAQDRDEARHGSTTRRRVGQTPTRAYGGDSRLSGDS